MPSAASTAAGPCGMTRSTISANCTPSAAASMSGDLSNKSTRINLDRPENLLRETAGQ